MYKTPAPVRALMAAQASALSLSASNSPIFRHARSQLQIGSVTCTSNCLKPDSHFMRLSIKAESHEAPKVTKTITNIRNKLWEVVPRQVKEFPWKKAENVALQQTLLVGQETLKWSLLALYVCSFLSDVVYSISRNKEFMIPLGLFVGILTTNSLLETSQDLSPVSKEKDSLRNLLIALSFLFALVKVIAVSLGGQGQGFLLHATNGALMQIIWLWRSSDKKQYEDGNDNSQQEYTSTM